MFVRSHKTPIGKVLALDPGLRNCGYAVLSPRDSGVRWIEGGVLRTDADRTLPFHEDFCRRTILIMADLIRLIDEHEPSLVVVEALTYPRSSKSASFLASIHASVATACFERNIPLRHVRRKKVLDMVGFSISKRGKRANKTRLKTAVIDWAKDKWPNADWPRAKAICEHQADAAATGFSLLQSLRASQTRLFG